MIKIEHLSKSFGSLRAVDDISFQVEPGEVLGFLGPNGAGKSTTMKMVTGFLTPTKGRIEVCGHDISTDPIAVKSRIGYLPEGAPLYPDMTAQSLLAFIGAMRGLSGTQLSQRIDEVVALVHLEGVRKQRIETLSKGFKRRVGLAQAILHDPDVLILDEPTDGLDPNQKRDVRKLIRSMAEGKVIVLSTHILEEVESVCTRAIIIANGRTCFDGTPDALRRMSRYHNAIALSLKAGTAGTDAGQQLGALAGVAQVESLPDENGLESYMLFPDPNASLLGTVSDFVHDKGWEVEHLHVEKGHLDEVFYDVTKGGAAHAGGPVA